MSEGFVKQGLAAAEDVAVQPLLCVSEGEEVADVAAPPTCGVRGAEGRGYLGLAEPVGVPQQTAWAPELQDMTGIAQ